MREGQGEHDHLKELVVSYVESYVVLYRQFMPLTRRPMENYKDRK